MVAAGVAIEVGSQRFARRSFSDIGYLYRARPMGGSVVPYVGAKLEYPTGIGLILYVLHTLSTSLVGFALLYAVCCVGAYLLTRRAIGRLGGSVAAAVWAGSPLIALYLFHNFDVFVVAAGVGALVEFDRRHYGRSGMWLAVAFVTKIFPVFWLLPLVVSAARRERRAGPPLAVCAAFGITVGIVNVPFMIGSFGGWWYPYRWQSLRAPNWESIWSYVERIAPSFDNPRLQSAIALGLVVVVTVAVSSRVDGSRGRLAAACLACTVGFLVVNRVYSPQYTLWVLPFLALLPVERRWVRTLYAVELTIYAVLFLPVVREVVDRDARAAVIGVLCAARLAVLVRLVVTPLRGLFRVEVAAEPALVEAATGDQSAGSGTEADHQHQ